MNEWWFYLRVIKNELKAGLVLHTRQLKEENERTAVVMCRFDIFDRNIAKKICNVDFTYLLLINWMSYSWEQA